MDLLNTALPAMGEAFLMLMQPERMMFLVLGVLLGLVVGILPGLGGIAGLSLVLPFIYGMDQVSGLALMVGLLAVIPTSDTFSSVLLGIPGSSSAQATVPDGFPLARKGQAARALSAAFTCSLYGGLIGAVVLTFFIFIARPLILAFGLPELLMLTVLGLSMVAILAGRVPLKGVIAAGLGLMAGTIGAAGAGGSLRMSIYDMPYLVDGLQLIIVGLGIYAIPEIVSLLREDSSVAQGNKLGAGWFDGIRDWWRNKRLSTKTVLIGTVVGIIPGLGGSVVDWIAYGYTVQSSRDKSQFGKGDIRGVIGPESAANATCGGALVPTLIFGIPGSGAMAVFLGGLAILNLSPGPQMVRQDLDIAYAIMWSLALANVIGAGLCVLLAKQVARITSIRFAILAPLLFMMIAFAAFQSRQSQGDLIALILIGLIGILLRRFDYSRPAFLIGFVLSSQAEAFTNMANQIATACFNRGFWNGIDYIAAPLSVGILVLTVISVVVGLRGAKHIKENDSEAQGGKRAPVVFLLCLMAYLAVSVIDAATISRLGDKIFPLTVGIVTLIACAVLLLQMRRVPETHPVFVDLETGGPEASMPHKLWPTLSWFAALLAMSLAFGLVIALTLFFLAFYRVRARLGWTGTLAYTALGTGGIILFARVLGRDFPAGLLQDSVNLPWPLR
ncbi:MAG: tripartite tricarboxylate transporter permease [Rhodobacterales bacterium]|nr:tripartite tricarboxylate transporter permease [Rhodobacterales bacterium]